VKIQKIPQASRHRVGVHPVRRHHGRDLEVWNAAGGATTQLFQPEKSYGADGMTVRGNITSIKNLKGRRLPPPRPAQRPTSRSWVIEHRSSSDNRR
jgi:NitT/TauT family transport system substrate-binding protein